MDSFPVFRNAASLLLRMSNSLVKYSFKEHYQCRNLLSAPCLFYSTHESCRLNNNQQEIIEDNYEENKVKSRAIIEKVNIHIASGDTGRLFAIIHAQGKQYRVARDDILIIPRNWPPTQFDKLTFEKVLLVGGPSFSLIGKPILPNNLVKVRGAVVNKDLTHTKIRFRYITGHRIHKLNFVREDLTYVRITDIELYPKLNVSEDTQYLRA